MIERILKSKLIEMANKYPIVTLTGPRQSGKSTLLRNSFQDYEYVSLEDPDMRLFATDDPRGFLSTYPDKTIIDEVQRVPSLFSYIQTHTDKENKEGNDHGCHVLNARVTEGVTAVGGLCRDFKADERDNGCGGIREIVDGIRADGDGASERARNEFACKEQKVHDDAENRYDGAPCTAYGGMAVIFKILDEKLS